MYWFEKLDIINDTEFTQQECSEAARTLTDILREWLERELARPQPYSHPLAQVWREVGPDSVVFLTTLARDLAVLREQNRFEQLIEHIQNTRTYRAAVHEAHTAALFSRGSNTNLELYPEFDGKNPDISFEVKGKKIFAECKTLQTSNQEKIFERHADKIQTSCFKAMDEYSNWCGVRIELTETLISDMITPIITAATQLIGEYQGAPIVRTTNHATIRIDKVPLHAKNVEFNNPKWMKIVCPPHPSERTRIQNTFKKAQKQLPAGYPTLICVDITLFDKSPPEKLYPTIAEREFSQEHNKNISAILFIQRRKIRFAGKIHHFDFIHLLKNHTAIHPVPDNLIEYIEPLGMIDLIKIISSYPCYERVVAEVRARFPDPSFGEIFFTNDL
jgi:hypothetical protein